jgi:hypothetical protein
VLLSLYTHFSRPFWTGQSLAYPVVQKSGAAAKPQLTKLVDQPPDGPE